mmetsp:Transcript_10766/g.22781  ORF Transcript_10766/g.22781 Transcript_10766/m.22781 type:complete len:236 (+) Transcript_10766:1976-2683(+)
MESHLLRRFRAVADQVVSEDKLHRTLQLLLEADNLEGQVELATGRHHLPRLLHHPVWDLVVSDLGEGHDRDTPTQLPLLEQGLARLLVVDDHEVETTSSRNLQGSVEAREVRLNVEELGNDALHRLPVEPPVRIRVVEVNASEVRPELVELLLGTVGSHLRLLRLRKKLRVTLRVELQLLQLRPLLSDQALSGSLVLQRPLSIRLVLRENLLGVADALLEVRNGHRLLLLIGLHL